MFAGNIPAPRQVEVLDVEPIALDGPDQILFRPELACLCGSDMLFFDADYPDLQLPELRQLGSKLRHDYDEIRPALIWRMLERRLGPLEEMARQELERLSRPM